jgi:hypothetical protein
MNINKTKLEETQKRREDTKKLAGQKQTNEIICFNDITGLWLVRYECLFNLKHIVFNKIVVLNSITKL